MPSTLEKNFQLIFAGTFLAFVVTLTALGKLPLIILGIYLIASIVTFFVYSIDKSAAYNDEWRTKESTLHLLAVAGGWPGALTAQKLLRHKSKKQSFQKVFWATVLINCGFLGWLFTHQGAENLRLALKTIQMITIK